MRAVVYTEYGPPDVLRLDERAQPVPKDNEILVRVAATSVNYGDLVARNLKGISPREFNMPLPLLYIARIMFGFDKPKNPILGSEFAGVVEAAGNAVTRFRPGDAVFGYRGQSMGAYAEYLCIAEAGEVAHKPANMSFEAAAVVPYGAITALNLLRKVPIQPGHTVLINGASGSIGLIAVQLAKHAGAVVTGVCSTPRLDVVQSLGADRVIDYTREDFTEGDATYDLIFDVLGRSSFDRCQRVLKPAGRYLLASFKTKHLLQMLWTARSDGQRVICAMAPEKTGDLPHIKELIEAGAIRAAIDKSFPLEEVATAHRSVEAGEKKGHIAITVRQMSET